MLKINEDRLMADLEALAQIGQAETGGMNRLALSAEDVAGRAWFKARVLADGFEFREDGAGNQSALLRSTVNPNARTVLAGSHLDSVPNGGKYDGPLGVLSALEALRTIREAGLQLPVHLEAINFTDEEGSVLGMIGSHGLTGHLQREEFARAKGGEAALFEGMRRIGISAESALASARDPQSLAGYVELHIEQGTRLESAHIDIGAVTSIVGIRWFWLQFAGQAAHAGTTPMDRRADAMLGAARFVQQVRERVMQRYLPGVVNCGQLQVQPGAFNIVAAQARLALEFRHATEDQLDQMEADLLALAQTIAEECGLMLTIEPLTTHAAALMDERVVSAIETAAAGLGLRHTRLASFAGHDAQSLCRVTPSAMIFVPSVDGISHNPREYTRQQDVVNGANVLLHTIVALSDQFNS